MSRFWDIRLPRIHHKVTRLSFIYIYIYIYICLIVEEEGGRDSRTSFAVETCTSRESKRYRN